MTKKNCVSCCLYGNQKKYYQDGLELLKYINKFIPKDFDIILYTDDVTNDCITKIEPFVNEIVNMSGYPILQGDRKACYRFQALDHYTTVVLLDLDFKQDMFGKVKNLILIADKFKDNLINHILTYNSEHQHENFKPIPAGLTIIMHDGKNKSIFHDVLNYVSKQPTLKGGKSLNKHFNEQHLQRYENGYGLDEKFLTFQLRHCIKDLRIIRNVFSLC